GAEIKVVAVVRACGVERRGDGDALVGGNAGARELAYQPAIGQLVVEQHRIAVAIRLADPTEAAPDRGDADGTQHGCARALVEYLVALVDDLDVLRQAGFTVG